MAKKKHHSRGGFSIPLAPIAGIAIALKDPIVNLMEGSPQGAIDALQRNFLLIDPATSKFEMSYVWRAYAPLVVGMLAHKFLGGWLGLNRMLARSKLPIRI